MKHIKPHKDLMFIANPALVIIGAFLFWYQLPHILSSFYLFWLTTVIVIMLIFTPFGSKRLCVNNDDAVKRLSTKKWLLRILLIEISMIGAYSGMCLVAGFYFPTETTSDTHLFISSLTQTMNIGFFPWPLYALIAVIMGIIAYREQKNAYFHTMFDGFIDQDPHSKLASVINASVKRCANFAIAVSLLFMIMLLLSLLFAANIHLTYGFHTTALFTTLVILIFSINDRIKNYLLRFFARKTSTAWGILSFCLLISFSIFLINTLISGMVLQAHTPPAKIPDIVMGLINKNWHTSWLIFSGLWALTFAPAVAAYFADISKGYRIRDMLLATLIPPAIIIPGLILLYQHTQLLLSFQPTVVTIITLLFFLLFLTLILKKDTLPNIIGTYFPNDGVVKQRDFHAFYRLVIFLIAICFYTFFSIGVTGLCLVYFIFLYQNILIVPLSVLASLKSLFSR